MFAERREQGLLGGASRPCERLQPALHALFEFERIVTGVKTAGQLQRELADDLDGRLTTVRFAQDAQPISSNHEPNGCADPAHVLTYLRCWVFELRGQLHLDDEIGMARRGSYDNIDAAVEHLRSLPDRRVQARWNPRPCTRVMVA